MSSGRQYRVICHLGSTLELATRMNSARAHVDDQFLYLGGANPSKISRKDLEKIELYRHHGVGSMIKCQFEGRLLFMTVVRLNLFGYFSIINFFGTRKLFRELNNNNITAPHSL